MDFVQKSKFFLSAFFTEILSENNIFDIVERKECFEVEKIEVLKKAKKLTFSIDFVQILNFLLSLFFTEIMSAKIVFGYSKSEAIIKRQENEV